MILPSSKEAKHSINVDLDRPVQFFPNLSGLFIKEIVKIPFEQNDFSYLLDHINIIRSCPIRQHYFLKFYTLRQIMNALSSFSIPIFG